MHALSAAAVRLQTLSDEFYKQEALYKVAWQQSQERQQRQQLGLSSSSAQGGSPRSSRGASPRAAPSKGRTPSKAAKRVPRAHTHTHTHTRTHTHTHPANHHAVDHMCSLWSTSVQPPAALTGTAEFPAESLSDSHRLQQ